LNGTGAYTRQDNLFEEVTMKNKVQLRQEMGLEVVRHLKEMTGLPATGYLAGQSVCSALFDLYVGKGEGAVYNDFDVFFHTNTSEHAIEKAYSDTVRYDTPVMEQDHYGELSFNSKQRYKVLASYRKDMVNLVACSFKTPKLTVADMVSTFDLNCVQVGLDLETGLLQWTPAFERFFATRELEIAQVSTPNHTAIRWFKKKAELPGVFGNDDVAMELVSLVQHCSQTGFFTSAPGEFKEFSDIRWRFGQKQLEVYRQYEDKLSKYFNLEDNTSIRNLKYLSPKHEVAADYREIASRAKHIQLLLALPRLLRLQHTAPVVTRLNHTLSGNRKGDNAFTSPYLLMASTLHYGLGYVAGNVAASHVDNIAKFIGKHSRMSYRVALQPSVLLQHQAVCNMQKLEKEFGRWTTGLLEDDVDFVTDQVSLLDIAELRKKMTVFRDNANVPLRRRYLPNFRLFGFSVRELSSRLALMNEGNEMRHCVGGYVNSVAKGNDCIFSIRGDAANPKTWSTVQIGREKGIWKVRQHTSLANAYPPQSHLRITALLAVALNLTKPAGLAEWTRQVSSSLKFALYPSTRSKKTFMSSIIKMPDMRHHGWFSKLFRTSFSR
jgi:hypothetical protein